MKMRLIDKEKALKIAEDYGTMHGTTIGRHSGIADIIHYELAGLPTIEAEPVKHGKWEFIVTHNGCTDDYDCKCSECSKSGVPSDRYCSYCGAKMTNTDSFNF